MLERLSHIFYDPWVFWSVPLALVVMGAAIRRLRGWIRRRR